MKDLHGHRFWNRSTLIDLVVVTLGACGYGVLGTPDTPDSPDVGQAPQMAADSAACPQVSRFDGVDLRRATIRSDGASGVVAQLAIGTDLIGNLYSDGQGNLTYEQHPIGMGGALPSQPLSPADRESLAVNIQRHMPAASPSTAPLWQGLLGAAASPWAQAPGLGGMNLHAATIEDDGMGGLTASFSAGVDVVGNLRSDAQGNVAYEQHPISFNGAHPLRPLSPADRQAFGANIDGSAMSTDPVHGAAWQQLRADMTTAAAQDSRFDGVDFPRATIHSDAVGGVTARFAIGVDLVGDLHADSQGRITYEQHPIVMVGSPTPPALPSADRESLAVNLQRHLLSGAPTAAALWQQLLGQATRCSTAP